MDRLWQRLGIKYPRAQMESLPSVQPVMNYEVQTHDIAEPNLVGAGNERGTKSVSYNGTGAIAAGTLLVESKLSAGVYGIGPTYFSHGDDFVNWILVDVLDSDTARLYYRWRIMQPPGVASGILPEVVLIVPSPGSVQMKLGAALASGRVVNCGLFIRRVAELLSSDLVGVAGGTFESSEMT